MKICLLSVCRHLLETFPNASCVRSICMSVLLMFSWNWFWVSWGWSPALHVLCSFVPSQLACPHGALKNIAEPGSIVFQGPFPSSSSLHDWSPDCFYWLDPIVSHSLTHSFSHWSDIHWKHYMPSTISWGHNIEWNGQSPCSYRFCILVWGRQIIKASVHVFWLK